MTDVSVEETTEETASPSEASGRPARPFSLSLSLSTVEPPLPSLSEPAPSPEEPTPSPDGPGPLRDEPEVLQEKPGALQDEPESFRDRPELVADEPAPALTEDAPSPLPPPAFFSSSSAAPGAPAAPAIAPDGPLPASPVAETSTEPEPAPRPVPVISPVPAAPSLPAAAVVKGRIKVADEVVEKVAALAALEVAGVAELRDDSARAAEPSRLRAGSGPAGARRGPRGVSAHVQDRTAAVDVTIVAEYGHVVMDVANEVKTSVARTISRMLGMRVVEVNVNVDDVRLPGETGGPAPVGPVRDA